MRTHPLTRAVRDGLENAPLYASGWTPVDVRAVELYGRYGNAFLSLW